MGRTKMKIGIGVILLCTAVLLNGCEKMGINETKEVQIKEEQTETIIIGEDPVQEQTTGTIVIEDVKDSQEKSLVDETENTQQKVLESDQRRLSAQILDNWTWERKENVTYIKGSLKNTGESPVGFFRIKAEYLDENGNVVDADMAVHGEVIWPGHQKKFKISKLYKGNYKSVRIWVEKLEKAKEPVIQISSGQDAEIVEGWTWQAKGEFSYIEGVIRNIGQRDIRYYKIMAEYADAEGHVLDSEFTNSNSTIKPGDEASFKIMHPYDLNFQEVTIYISVLK